jgi:hypothetical protein
VTVGYRDILKKEIADAAEMEILMLEISVYPL